MWMVSNQVAGIANSDQIVSNDPVKSLAEKGDAEAELRMGLRYTSNARGIKDDKVAAQWFEKAARHGQVEAQYRYGLALQTGQGLIQDFKAGFYWLEKAARQGYAEAQFAVGKMYHDGDFIKKDIEQAYLWFNLAAAQGLDKAISARDLASDLLTPDQLVVMQEEAKRISNNLQSAPVASMPKVEVTKSQPGVKADEPVNP
jgi:TPR repeat protein